MVHRVPPDRMRPRWGFYMILVSASVLVLVAVWGFWPRSTPLAPRHAVSPARPTVRAVVPPSPSPSVSPQWPKSYVVQPGDTLGAIATRFYGSSAGWPRIAAMNDISGAAISPGQKLVIPAP